MSSECKQLDCQVFVGMSDPNCSVYNRDNFQAEQIIYQSAYKDLINQFGINIRYFVNTFNLTSGDVFFGEQPYKKYGNPVEMRVYAEVSDNAISLQRFGFVSDDEFTGYIDITTFTTTFSTLGYHTPNGQRIEPKSGDVIELTDLGYCRPGARGPRLYEITERVDQDFNSINPALGTYVWRIRGKRFAYSYEPGLSAEGGTNPPVYDNTFTGVVSSTQQAPSPNKNYPYDVNEDSIDNVYDQRANDTSIYGGYY
jgi:hypothetical protein